MSLADKIRKHIATAVAEKKSITEYLLEDVDVAEARELCREPVAFRDFAPCLVSSAPVPNGVVGYFNGLALRRPDEVKPDAIEEKREAHIPKLPVAPKPTKAVDASADKKDGKS